MDLITLALTMGETDKLKKSGGVGYTETAWKEVFSETFENMQSGASKAVKIDGNVCQLEVGKTYKVHWDGVDYTLPCKIVNGNPALEVVDSKPVWRIRYVRSSNYTQIIQNTGVIKTINCVVQAECEVPHTINPKFLPQGGFGYTEASKNELFAEQTVQLEPTGSGGSMGTLGESNPLSLVVDKFYIVCVNGTDYRCKCVKDFFYGNEIIYLGNAVEFGKEDTGEPFVLMSTGGMTAVAIYDEVTSVTLAVYAETEIIRPIDPKFLPEGSVGYTEKGQVYLLQDQALEFSNDGYLKLTESLNLVENAEYTVVWDGIEYKQVCKKDVDGRLYIGNLVADGGSVDSNEHFLFVEKYDADGKLESTEAITVVWVASSHTVTISTEGEVIHPIEQKFIVLTSPSGKKFNLAVDDSGTITAVEV